MGGAVKSGRNAVINNSSLPMCPGNDRIVVLVRNGPGKEFRNDFKRAGRHINVQVSLDVLYVWCMEVAISTLRAELADWIERAQDGEEVIITERGTPVARLSSVDTAPLLEQLTQRGILSKPIRASRPTASAVSRVHAHGPVAELVGHQRR